MSRAKEMAQPPTSDRGCNQLQLGELCILVKKGTGAVYRTSPGNLYPALMWTWNFCWRNPLDGETRIPGSQFGAKLTWVLVMDAM